MRDVSRAARRIGEMKWLKSAKEGGDISHTFLGRAPEDGMLARIRDFERLLRRETDEAVVAGEPILREHPDVDVNAERRSRHPDGIRAVFQDVGHRHFLFFPWQGECAAGYLLRLRDALPLGKEEDGIDRVRIVDVIGGDARGIGGAGRLRVQASRKRNRLSPRCRRRLFLRGCIDCRSLKRDFPSADFPDRAGGLLGFGAMWQEPQATPTRYGRMSLLSL